MERKMILVVDDDSSITDMLKASLESRYEVKVVNEGLKAMEVALNVDPDLIILDVDLAYITGGEIANQIGSQRELQNTPIIFLTGLLLKEEERDIAGHPFLSKPVNIVELYECIENNLKSDFEGHSSDS